jgi:hypothetical protein
MSYVKIQVLAILTYDIRVVYDVIYDIVCLLYNIVGTTYDIGKKCTISEPMVGCRTFFTGSCHFDVRHRIRYRMFFDDVAYDV